MLRDMKLNFMTDYYGWKINNFYLTFYLYTNLMKTIETCDMIFIHINKQESRLHIQVNNCCRHDNVLYDISMTSPV